MTRELKSHDYLYAARPTRAYSLQALVLDKPIPDFTKTDHHYEAEPSQTVTFRIFVTVFFQASPWDDVAVVSDGGYPPNDRDPFHLLTLPTCTCQ